MKNTKDDPRGVEAQRWGLIKKIHVAKRDLGLDVNDATYRAILFEFFGKTSSKELRIFQMERLINHFIDCGFVPTKARDEQGRVVEKPSYHLALRERVYQLARELCFTKKRLRGLCQHTCQINDPIWCNPTGLLRLLAALENIKREEAKGGQNAENNH